MKSICKIKINSSKIKKGNLLLCIEELNSHLTKGENYEIVDITDSEIWIIDNDNDVSYPSKISLDKKHLVNIFKHFKVW